MKKGMLFEAMAVLLLILLAFAMYVMVTSGGTPPTQWTLGNLTLSPDASGAMSIGPGDVLYVASGPCLNAIAPDGTVKWRAAIPGDNGTYGRDWLGLKMAFDNDTICLLAAPRDSIGLMGQQPPWDSIAAMSSRELLVFSSDGALLWRRPLSDVGISDPISCFDVSIGGGQIYLHEGSNETVYTRSGRILWEADNICFTPDVDGNGTLYAMPGICRLGGVDAYYPNGSLKWRYGLGNDSFDLDSTMQNWKEPICSNHTIYVERNRGLTALNEDGSLRWKKDFHDAEYVYMDFQSDGNWYVSHVSFNDNGTADNSSYLSIIHPDGSEIVTPRLPSPRCNMLISNGIAYYYGNGANGTPAGLNGLSPGRIEAYDAVTGDRLWGYTIRPGRSADTTLNESTARVVMYREMQEFPDSVLRTNRLTPKVWYEQHALPDGYEEVRGSFTMWLTPWSGGVYVSYWAYNYEYPFFFDRSRCVYGGGLYAFDRNGTLLWSSPADSEISALVANNGTVYYGTRSGKISASTGGVAAGFALTAALYLLIRFFLAGAVTRARGLVDKNEKRNRILEYIIDNPGASLFDISKDLNMNMGTVRYHLMILGINHRIVSYRADDKYVRYFTNAGSYSPEQQLIVSMMRREGIRKVLNVLIERPGRSNIELAREMGVHESAISRYMKELVEKGVVSREHTGDGRLAYAIKNEYREPIAFAIERLAAGPYRANRP